MRYVRFGENRESMYGFGSSLSQKQTNDLWFKGIEPEDIEIIYIDDDYNVLPVPPPLAK